MMTNARHRLKPLLHFSALAALAFVASCNNGYLGSANVEKLRPRAMRIITDGLYFPDPQVRSNAIEAAANTNQLQLMPRVQQLLGDNFVPVRFAAAVAVGDMNYEPAAEDLDKLLTAPDQHTRLAAAYALVRLGRQLQRHTLC